MVCYIKKIKNKPIGNIGLKIKLTDVTYTSLRITLKL
jgi:hypothetical protein